MDNDTSPTIDLISETPVVALSAILVAFHYTGLDNGVPRSGFDSRVVQGPRDVKIETSDDIKTIADAIANSEFMGGRKFENLEITINNIVRLPV